MPTNIEKGKIGENFAQKYLLEKGYEILAKNYRYSRFEIDIIAQKDEILVFIEVKYRKSLQFGYPEQAVSQLKIKQIKSAAEQYLFEKNWNNNIRFDIISIVDQKKSDLEILHLEDAF